MNFIFRKTCWGFAWRISCRKRRGQSVNCEENAYPLAYRRFQEEESVLIVVNPSGKDASFAYDGKLGDVIYQNGKDFTLEDGVFTIPGATAVFVKEER